MDERTVHGVSVVVLPMEYSYIDAWARIGG